MSFFLSRFVKSSSTGTVTAKNKELAGAKQSGLGSSGSSSGSSGKKSSYKAEIFTPLPSECIRTLKSAGIRPDEAERHFEVLCNVLLFEFKKKPLIKSSIETVLRQRKQERRQTEREERRKLKAERRAKRAEAAKQLAPQATPAAQPADATNASTKSGERQEKAPASATTPSPQPSSTTTPPPEAASTTTTSDAAATTTTTTTTTSEAAAAAAADEVSSSSSLLQLSTSPSPSNGKKKRRRHKGKSKMKSKSKTESPESQAEATTTTTTTESKKKKPKEHRSKEHRSKEQSEATLPSSSATAPPASEPAPASAPAPSLLEDPTPSLPAAASTPPAAPAQEEKKGSKKKRPRKKKDVIAEKEHLAVPILRSTSDPTSMARITREQTGMALKSAGIAEEKKTGSRKEASSRSSGSRTHSKVEANGVKSTGKADSSKLGGRKKSSPENSKIIEKAMEEDGLISLTDPTKVLTSKSKVGHGSFGEVFTAKDSQRGCTVAVKILKKKFDVNQSAVRNEISNLKACHHENIVNFLGAYLYNNKVWVVMEYCDGGSLNQLLSEVVLSESQIAYICKEILQGLNYLHTHNRIHRDIKSDNVLLNINGRVKLADLGLCAEMKEGKSYKASVVGSRYWMAPEMIQRKPYTCKVDIWSLAALCYEMTEGGPPYSNVRSIKAMFWTATRGAPPMRHPERWSSDFHSFLKHSTDMNPEARGSAEQLLKHRFISKACERTKLAQAIEIVFLGNSLRMNGF